MGNASYNGDEVIWRGRPVEFSTPPLLTATALLLFALAGISTCFAVAISATLGLPPTSSLVFAIWSASLGLFVLHAPRWWLSGVEYVVTRERVIWQRGPFRRSIARGSVSFARIFWSAKRPGVGDVELVRAVPTGALRRRLRLRLQGVSGPARVAAIIAGTEGVTPAASGEHPLAQRLEAGERVVWAARPRSTWRAYVPRGQRRIMLLTLALALMAVLVQLVLRAVPNLSRLLDAGMTPTSASFLAIVVGTGATALIVAAVAAHLFDESVLRPGRQVSVTRYLVTNRRVLIQRGREELHLDRSKIVDVIEAPSGDGLRDVFLVLDGPQARALAASGAFGEGDRGPGLRPVLEAVEDADGVQRVLLEPPPSLPHAA